MITCLNRALESSPSVSIDVPCEHCPNKNLSTSGVNDMCRKKPDGKDFELLTDENDWGWASCAVPSVTLGTFTYLDWV